MNTLEIKDENVNVIPNRQVNKVKGEKILLFTGIISVFLNVFYLIAFISVIMQYYKMFTIHLDDPIIIGLLVDFIPIMFSFYIGVLAILYCKKIEKAKLLSILSILHIAVLFIYLVYQFYNARLVGFSDLSDIFIDVVILLPIDIFIIVGAILNYKVYKANIH